MKIQILGPGCSRCKQLAASAQQAVADLGLQAEIEKVEDMREIVKFKIMATPALVVDGVVRSSGKVLNADAVKELLRG